MLKGHTYSSRVFFLGMLVFGSLCLEFTAPSVSASSSISMSVDTNALNVNVLPNSPNGNFASSNSMTIDITLTGPGGYTLGVSGTSTDLVHTTDNTKVFSSISSATSSSDFSADTSTAATNFNGKWGYLPSKYNSLANTSYLPAPDSTGDILDVTHGVNDEGEYTISFGARASKDMTVGTYSGTFVITAVSNYSCSVGNVCYYDNGADGGTMDNQAIGVGDTEVELVGSNYSKLGYGFAGWSPTMLDPDDANFASDFAAATVYGPMETVSVPSERYIELYAVWVPSSGNLQGWTGCSSLNTGDVIALTDTRDGNGYAVSKLADGQCWIIENLRLDFSDEDVELTNMNTNHPTAKFMDDANAHPEPVESYDVGYVDDRFTMDIKYKDRSKEYYSDGNNYNYYTYRGGNGRIMSGQLESYARGDICPAGWRMPTYYNSVHDYSSLVTAITGSSLTIFTPTSTPTASFVTNSLTTFPNNFVGTMLYYVSDSLANGDTSFDFMPTGMFKWSSNFYSASHLTYSHANTYGFVVRCIAATPGVYTLSFDANGGTNAPADETSSNGIFEDISTSVPIRNGYIFVGWMDENGIMVQPGDDYNVGIENTSTTLYAIWKNNSCNDSATTIGTGNGTDAVCMQDMNGAVKSFMASANLAAGSIQTYSLIDARDGQSYDIALLDDGNVWMTKNLNLGRNSSNMLSYVDTNLPPNQSFLLDAADTSTRYYNGETNDGYYNNVYYGGYYEWKIATAAYGYGSAGVSRSTSICPFGWTLPTPVHYDKLIVDASLTDYTTASVAPYNFNNGGYADISKSNNTTITRSFWNQGSTGYYWTAAGSSYTSDQYAIAYLLSSSDFLPSSSTFSMSRASSVRCIVNNGMATINYDGNGSSAYPASGSVPSQTVDINTGNVARNGFTRNGYAFKGWNTRADGTGTDVAVGSDVYSLNLSDGDEITLYAQWTPRVIITYNDNYTGVSIKESVSSGLSTTLGGYNRFTTKPGYSIKEWNTEPDGSGTTYAVSSSYTAPADMTEPILITLYAQWIEDYVITFVDTESGETQTKNITWSKSGTVAPPTAWSYTGYKLLGWDTVANSGLGGGGTVVYTNNQSITPSSNLTVYTVWAPFSTIQYDGNGATGTTAMAITQEAGQGEEITLYASNFSRSGYGFAGWSFDSNAASDLANATVYGPNATITAPNITTPGETKTLYAVWIEAESGVTMQTFDSTAQPYASAPEGTVIALTDSRDSDTYAVAKLADGNWWMIENYRLGGTSAITLNNTNSAIASSSFSLPASSSSFSTNNTTAQISTDNETSTVSSMVNIDSNVYSYGNYYSWNAAIGSSTSYNSTTVSNSICPYGWHLPTGGASGNFANLSLELGGLTTTMDANTTPIGAAISKVFRDYPNNFVYSSLRSSRYTVGNRGSNGYYYSSTSYNSSTAKHLLISDESISPDNNNPNIQKYRGMSIRCIAGT